MALGPIQGDELPVHQGTISTLWNYAKLPCPANLLPLFETCSDSVTFY